MTTRIDLFTLVHKGIRWWLGSVSATLGATDFTSEQSGVALAALEELLRELDGHAHHEDTFILPLVRERAPARAAIWNASHARFEGIEGTLREAIATLRANGPAHESARSNGLALYRAFNRFAAETLEHLDEEETELMPLLWATCSDADLAGVMQHFSASCGPEAAAFHHRVASAYAPAERAMLGL